MKSFVFNEDELFYLRRSVLRLKNCLKADLSSYLEASDAKAVDGCVSSISILSDLLIKLDF